MMEIFGISDPAHVGSLILLAVAILGGAVIALVLRMPTGFPASLLAKRRTKLKKRRRQSIRNIPKKPDQTVEKCRNKGLDPDAQWDRYATRLKEAIEASRRAANHHIKATTQLDAAEFAACELFKEYPGARNCLNPVIYVEFPALKNHEANGRSEGESRIPAIA